MIDKDDLIQAAMQMILHAGDARALIMAAYDAVYAEDFVKAQTQLDAATGLLAQAHHHQTAIVQSEADGETIPYSPLFSHAQDTMMTIYSEHLQLQKLLLIFKKLSEQSK